jgi:hypothetical protein
MNTTTASFRVQHDNPCPAWGIAAATGIGGSGSVAYTAGSANNYYGTYADWATCLQLLYQVSNYDYLDGTHTTNSGLPTSAAYALYGMGSSGTINVQAFMTAAGLLPW